MLAKLRLDWAPRSWAVLCVLAVHVVFAMLLLSGRHISLAAPTQTIQVSFPSTEQPSEPWQPSLPQVNLDVEAPVQVPMPEVKVAPAPAAITARAVEAAPSSDPVPVARPQPILISEVEYLKQPVSRYPHASKRLREQGTVVLRVLVDETGHASQVNVYRSSGFPRLDAAACEAVRQAVFKPYVSDGRTQAALVLVPIEFSLKA